MSRTIHGYSICVIEDEYGWIAYTSDDMSRITAFDDDEDLIGWAIGHRSPTYLDTLANAVLEYFDDEVITAVALKGIANG